jgi:hypothetical protein
MRTNPKGWCYWCTGLLLLLFLSVSSVGLAKSKSSKRSGDYDIANIVRPDLVNGQTDPTLRFPVMSMPGSVFSITYGWFDISNSAVRYTVVQPTSKSDHSFEVSRFAVGNLRFNRTVLLFKAPKKQQMIIFLPPDRWGSVHTGPGMGSVANRESLGTSSIYKTLLNFEGVMALVKPPAPPAPVIVQAAPPPPQPKPAAPPPPPAIVLSSPAGAGENQTLELTESTVVIRGVALDTTGIPVVRINGVLVSMRPQTPQAVEFWSDPLPLQAGDNHIQIVASNSAHVESKLDLTVDYKPKTAPVNPRALARLDIISLLQGGVPPARVADLVKDRGIRFSASADDLNSIRAAGGTDDLIGAIQQAAPHS